MLLKSESKLVDSIIKKEYIVANDKEELELNYYFSSLKRQFGFVRACFLTITNYDHLTNCSVSYKTSVDQEAVLKIPNHDFNHGLSISNKISSQTFIPAKYGYIYFNSEDHSIKISWNKNESASYPMAELKKVGDKFLFRIYFSLGESDETFRHGGSYTNLKVKLESI